jgi:hypothetical protein
MNRYKAIPRRIFELLFLLSVASLPANAQDICSQAGKSKMLAANVTESQISMICSSIAEGQKGGLNKVIEYNLARQPIGVDVQVIGSRAGATYVDISVRNNSGEFIKRIYLEVIAYNDEVRVGATNYIFNSVNIGESMVARNSINTSGRPWNGWRFTYKIY